MRCGLKPLGENGTESASSGVVHIAGTLALDPAVHDHQKPPLGVAGLNDHRVVVRATQTASSLLSK